MVRRLREAPPKIIFMEGCEDMRPLLASLADCKLPVALQALRCRAKLSSKRLPLNCIAPITEFSAEYQAIAYAMQTQRSSFTLSTA
ncbi:MAG: DUF5682 family protein [Polyangiaceae bacterium]